LWKRKTKVRGLFMKNLFLRRQDGYPGKTALENPLVGNRRGG
jgi:hypothetical protein